MSILLRHQQIPDSCWEQYGKLIGKIWRVYPDAEISHTVEVVDSIGSSHQIIFMLRVRRRGTVHHFNEPLLVDTMLRIKEDDRFWEFIFRKVINEMAHMLSKEGPDETS